MISVTRSINVLRDWSLSVPNRSGITVLASKNWNQCFKYGNERGRTGTRDSGRRGKEKWHDHMTVLYRMPLMSSKS